MAISKLSRPYASAAHVTEQMCESSLNLSPVNSPLKLLIFFLCFFPLQIAIRLNERPNIPRPVTPKPSPPPAPAPVQDDVAIFLEYLGCQIRTIRNRRRRMILQNEIQQVVYKTALFECQDPDPEYRPTYGTQFGLTPTSYTHGGSTGLSLYNYPEPSLPATNMGQIRNSLTPINYQTPMSGQSNVTNVSVTNDDP